MLSAQQSLFIWSIADDSRRWLFFSFPSQKRRKSLMLKLCPFVILWCSFGTCLEDGCTKRVLRIIHHPWSKIHIYCQGKPMPIVTLCFCLLCFLHWFYSPFRQFSGTFVHFTLWLFSKIWTIPSADQPSIIYNFNQLYV